MDTVRSGGTITGGCEVAGIHRRTFYSLLAADKSLRAELDRALDESIAPLIDEAIRRGVEGWIEDVYQTGKKVGTIRRYSDRMLELLLRSRDARFRSDPSIQVTNTIATQADVLAGLKGKLDAIAERRDRLCALLEGRLSQQRKPAPAIPPPVNGEE